MTSKINNFLLVSAVLCVILTPVASAQTLTWVGGQSNSGNVSGVNNWLGGNAPAVGNDYDFVFDAANLVSPNRTSATWNVATVGFSSLTLTGDATYPSFTIAGTTSVALKGNVTVTSGQHIFNTTATVVNDATWDIASGASLSRATTDTLTMAADRKITKTGEGTLTLSSSNTGITGTLEVQQGVLRVRTVDNTLGSATLALNGGTFEIFSNNARANANVTTTVIGESTVRSARDQAGAGLSHVMGALQLGSSTLTVTANELNTSGTANVTFGNTTLSNDATLEVANNIAGATTQLTLGAVGETGGARGLTKTGDGQLLLSAAGTFSGGLTLDAGVVLAGHDNALGAGTFTINGGTFASDGATARTMSNAITMGGNVQLGDATGTGALTLGSVNLGGAGRTFTVANDTTLAGAVTNGGLTKGGTGTLFLDNAASSFGHLEITAGRVDVQNNVTVTGLAGSGGDLGLSGGTLTVHSSADSAFGQVISGVGHLSKTGLGQLTLTGNNTFTGATVVTGGVFNLNSSAGSSLGSTASVSVTNATLLISQSDQVSNAAAVSLSGGTIRRGGNVSEVFGNLNLTTTSFLDYGAGNDAGTIRFGAYTPSALLTVQNFLPGNKLQFGNTISSTDLNNATLFSFSNGFTTGTESGFFTITAIPEPSTYLAAAGVLAVLMWPSRRRLLKAAKSVFGFRAPDLPNTSGIDRGLHC